MLQFDKNQKKKRKLGGSWWQTSPDKGNKFRIKSLCCESVLGFPCVASLCFYRASFFLFLLQSSTSIKKTPKNPKTPSTNLAGGQQKNQLDNPLSMTFINTQDQGFSPYSPAHLVSNLKRSDKNRGVN